MTMPEIMGLNIKEKEMMEIEGFVLTVLLFRKIIGCLGILIMVIYSI